MSGQMIEGWAVKRETREGEPQIVLTKGERRIKVRAEQGIDAAVLDAHLALTALRADLATATPEDRGDLEQRVQWAHEDFQDASRRAQRLVEREGGTAGVLKAGTATATAATKE